MKKEPIVYIILPIYNGEKYFLEQLMSIYHQTYTNWYLIIINDWSTDSSESIAKKFIKDYDLHDKVKILKKENWGLNSGIQKWLEEVKRICNINKSDNLVAYCDCDDIWTRNKLAVQVEYMVSHPECGLLYCNLLMIDENWRLTDIQLWDKYYNSGDFIHISTIWIFCIATTMIFKSEYIDDIVPMPTYPWMAQDIRTLMVLSLLGVKILYLNKKLCYYRKLNTWMQWKLESKPKNIQNQTRMNYFIFLKKRFSDMDVVSYVHQYNYDRYIKWYNKWYSLITIYLLMLFKYPKIFFLWLKAVLCRKIFNYKI